MKSPFSKSFKSAVQGEWSDITKSMSRDLRASHKASLKRKKEKIVHVKMVTIRLVRKSDYWRHVHYKIRV